MKKPITPCPNCGQKVNFGLSFVGKMYECYSCGAEYLVRMETDEEHKARLQRQRDEKATKKAEARRRQQQYGYMKDLKVKDEPEPMYSPEEIEAGFEKFVAHVQCITPDPVGIKKGPTYWRIHHEFPNPDRISTLVFAFVRRRDGAIFAARGWRGPDLIFGYRGNVCRYFPEILYAIGHFPNLIDKAHYNQLVERQDEAERLEALRLLGD